MKKVFLTSVASIAASVLFAATMTTVTTDLVNSTVYVQTSIKQVENGDTTVVYTETQEPRTDGEGKCTFEIGKGTVTSGDYATIDTTKADYIYVIGINENGSNVYTDCKTIQESDIKSNDLSEIDALKTKISKLEAEKLEQDKKIAEMFLMIEKINKVNIERDIKIKRSFDNTNGFIDYLITDLTMTLTYIKLQY